jgi:hypothetical protein
MRLCRGPDLESRLKRDIVNVWREHHYEPIRFSDLSKPAHGDVYLDSAIQSQRGLHSFLVKEAARGTPSVLLAGFLDRSYLVRFRVRLLDDGSYGSAQELYPGSREEDPTSYTVTWPNGNAGEPVLVNTRDRADIISGTRLRDLHAIGQADDIPAVTEEITNLRRSYVYETHGYNRMRDAREALHLMSSLGDGARATLIGWRRDDPPEYFSIRNISLVNYKFRPNVVEYVRQDVSGWPLSPKPVVVQSIRSDTLPGLADLQSIYIKVGRFSGDGLAIDSLR